MGCSDTTPADHVGRPETSAPSIGSVFPCDMFVASLTSHNSKCIRVSCVCVYMEAFLMLRSRVTRKGEKDIPFSVVGKNDYDSYSDE